MKKIILNLLSELLNINKRQIKDSLDLKKNNRWDSLTKINFIIQLNKLSLNIKIKDLEKAKTPKDIIKMIK
jgi:acyl carrier protein